MKRGRLRAHWLVGPYGINGMLRCLEVGTNYPLSLLDGNAFLGYWMQFGLGKGYK